MTDESDAESISKPDPLPDIHPQSMMVMGNKGTGKTYYAKALCRHHGYTTLVCTPHLHDFDDEPDNFIFYDDYKPKDPDSVEETLRFAKKLAQDGHIDVVLIDEFDMPFRHNWDVGDDTHDVIINQRHYGLGIIGITRRPQDIPQFFFGQTLYKVTFALESSGAKRKLDGLYRGWGDKVLKLRQKSREYYMKEIGVKPIKYDAKKVLDGV